MHMTLHIAFLTGMISNFSQWSLFVILKYIQYKTIIMMELWTLYIRCDDFRFSFHSIINGPIWVVGYSYYMCFALLVLHIKSLTGMWVCIIKLIINIVTWNLLLLMEYPIIYKWLNELNIGCNVICYKVHI